MQLLDNVEHGGLRQDIPEFRPGDTLAVHVKIREGEKERIQIFEGIVLRRRRGGTSASFTVRKISYGVGVERSFPLNSPSLDKIEVLTRGSVRQARLYYQRDLKGKAARIKVKRQSTQTPASA